jgi:hypothetical protein
LPAVAVELDAEVMRRVVEPLLEIALGEDLPADTGRPAEPGLDLFGRQARLERFALNGWLGEGGQQEKAGRW